MQLNTARCCDPSSSSFCDLNDPKPLSFQQAPSVAAMGHPSDDGTVDLRDSGDAWEEIIDEPLQTYVGCGKHQPYVISRRIANKEAARNYYYRGSGQINLARPLSAWLQQDQADLALLPSPTCRTTGFEPPPEYTFESPPTYYSQLLGPDWTRFLEVLPGREGIVECRLHAAPVRALEDQYEALSYASRKARCLPDLELLDLPTEKVSLNGSVTDCRQDLAQLLRKLRLAERRRLLWCPHLCINLDSIRERNEHTRLSPTIYGSARRVIAWLGEDSFKDPGQSFGSMCTVLNIWRRQSGLLERVDEADYLFKPEPSPFGGPPLQKPSEPNLTDAWSTLIAFYRNVWFCSIWSLSEVATAKDAVVMLEDNTIRWDWVGLCACILHENYGRVRGFWHPTWPRGRQPEVTQAIVHAAFMYRVSKAQSYCSPATLRLDQLLPLSARFDSRVEADRIYALRGISSGDKHLVTSITVDYNDSSAKRRHDMAKVLLDAGQTDLLARVQQSHGYTHMKPGGYNPAEIRLDGPSWCPQKAMALHEPILPIHPHPSFCAGILQSDHWRMQHPKTSDDGQALGISTIIIDDIKSVTRLHRFDHFWRGSQPDTRFSGGNELPPPPRAPGAFGSLMTQHEFEDLEEKLRPGITEIDLQRMATTFTCGKGWDGSPLQDIKRHTADYARCILRQGAKWSPNNAARKAQGPSPGPRQSFLTMDGLWRLSEGGHADRFLDAAISVGWERSYFKTQKGLWGVGPGVLKEGDKLCAFIGVGVPFTIRPTVMKGRYQLVGECYVLDVMHGEVLQSLETGADGLEQERILLV